MTIQATLQQMNVFLNTLPQRVRNSPRDEQAAYYAIFTGIILLLLGIVVNLIV